MVCLWEALVVTDNFWSLYMDPKDLETLNNILLDSEKPKNAAQIQTSAITNLKFGALVPRKLTICGL